MAMYFECRINKNTLLQTVFWAILPTGIVISREGFLKRFIYLTRYHF